MIPETIESIARDLKAAAGHRQYAEVADQVVRLCSVATECVKALPPDDPHAMAVVVYVTELLEWTDVMLRSARAAEADELRRVPFLKGYLQQERMSNL